MQLQIPARRRLGISIVLSMLATGFGWVALQQSSGSSLPIRGLFGLVAPVLAFAVLLKPRRAAMWILFGSLLYPYRFYVPIGPINSFSIADLAIPAVCTILILSRPRPVRPSSAVGDELAVIGLFALSGAASLLWAPRWNMWLREMIRTTLNVGIFFSGYMLITPATLSRAWKAYAGLGIGAMVVSIIYRIWHLDLLYIYPHATDPLVIQSWRLRFGSPTWGASNLFAGTMLLFLAIYVALAVSHKRRNARRFFASVSLACGTLILMTISAGGIAASIVSLLMLLLLLPRFRMGRELRRFALRLATLSILTVVGFWMVLQFMPREINEFVSMKFRDLSDQPGTTDRILRFRSAAAFAIEHPLGAGLGNYVIDAEEGTRNLVHNGYLQVLVETGWPGMVAFACLLASFASVNLAFIKAAKGTLLEPYALGAAACLGGFLFQMFGEPIFEATITGWLLWLLQGLVAGSHSLLISRQVPSQKPGHPSSPGALRSPEEEHAGERPCAGQEEADCLAARDGLANHSMHRPEP